MLGIRAVEVDTYQQASQFLKNRKDKFGSAGKEFAEGIGDMVSNPIQSTIGLMRLAAGNPWAWEQVADQMEQAWTNDPEKRQLLPKL